MSLWSNLESLRRFPFYCFFFWRIERCFVSNLRCFLYVPGGNEGFVCSISMLKSASTEYLLCHLELFKNSYKSLQYFHRDRICRIQPVKSGVNTEAYVFTKDATLAETVVALLCHTLFNVPGSHSSNCCPLMSYEHKARHFSVFTVHFWHVIRGHDPRCCWNHLPWRSSHLCSP